MITIIKANYFYAYKDISKTEMQAMARTWFLILGKEPKELVMAGFYKALEHCKMPPTIADIREEIDAMYDAVGTSDTELWTTLRSALISCRDNMSRFNYGALTPSGLTQGEEAREKCKKLWEDLPIELKNYLGDYNEFKALAWRTENMDFEKGRFLKSIKEIKQRLRVQAELPAEIKAIAQESSKLLIENKNEHSPEKSPFLKIIPPENRQKGEKQ